MSQENFYTPQATQAIKTTLVSQNDSIRAPFVQEAPTAAVGPQETDRDLHLPETWVVITNEHGRSVEDKRVEAAVIYEDQHHVLFGSRGLKGGRMENVVVEPDDTSPYGFRVNGLKDNVGLKRIDQVSEEMRQAHLPTELVSRKFKVEEVVVAGKVMPIDEWKNMVIQELKAQGKHEEAQKIRTYFEQTDFFIVERHTQVPERLRDVAKIKDAAQLRQMLQPIFNWLYAANKVSEGTDRWQYHFSRKLDAQNDEDLLYFFTDWVPKQMGAFLGQLHTRGLFHGYATSHNWSLAACLFDLDSVQNAREVGADATQAISKDLLESILGLRIVLIPTVNYDLPASADILRKALRNKPAAEQVLPGEATNEALIRFLENYLRTIPDLLLQHAATTVLADVKAKLNDLSPEERAQLATLTKEEVQAQIAASLVDASFTFFKTELLPNSISTLMPDYGDLRDLHQRALAGSPQLERSAQEIAEQLFLLISREKVKARLQQLVGRIKNIFAPRRAAVSE